MLKSTFDDVRKTIFHRMQILNLMIFILRTYPRVIWGPYVAFGNSRRFLSLTLTSTNT